MKTPLLVVGKHRKSWAQGGGPIVKTLIDGKLGVYANGGECSNYHSVSDVSKGWVWEHYC